MPALFVIRADGGTPVRVTHDDSHADSAPFWSPDSEWITFESREARDEDSPAALWRIPVTDALYAVAPGTQ